jgi:hypothetical protein
MHNASTSAYQFFRCSMLFLFLIISALNSSPLLSQTIVLDFLFEQNTSPSIDVLAGTFSLNGAFSGPDWVGGTNLPAYQQECLAAGTGGWGMGYTGWNAGEAFSFTFNTLNHTNLAVQICNRTSHPGATNFGTMELWGFDGSTWEVLWPSWTQTGAWDGSWGTLPAHYENKPVVILEERKLNNASSGSDEFFIDNFQVFALNPLPIELETFQGWPENHQIILNWRCTAEKSNREFRIERSADGRRWNTIGTLPGHGTTATPESYAFTDTDPLPALNYYRLRQADQDGRETISSAIQVRNSNTSKVWLSPNPGQGIFDIHAPDFKPETIRVRDMNGRTMAQLNGENSRVDVSALPKGVYMIEMWNERSRYADLYVKY